MGTRKFICISYTVLALTEMYELSVFVQSRGLLFISFKSNAESCSKAKGPLMVVLTVVSDDRL